jgi:hypothetical protein
MKEPRFLSDMIPEPYFCLLLIGLDLFMIFIGLNMGGII